MKNDDAVIPNIPEIKIISPLSPRDQVIETTPEDRTSSSSNSSGSSLSDLKRRLQDLPSPNEFTLLTDRVAALSRRTYRKRELFLRLHEVASRIDEKDEWEEREQRVEPECSLVASRPKNARARRRARILLESSLHDDKAMLISQVSDHAGPSTIIENDDKSNPVSTVSSIDRSARDADYFRLPAIEKSHRQDRFYSSSEPSSTRFPHHNNGKSCDTRNKVAFHTYQNFSLRNNAPKSADFPLVSPFSLSSVRPKKFGGYRPSSGVVMKNLSSESESESAIEATRGFPSARNVGNSIATSELSSPESKVTDENGTTSKKTFMFANSDVAKSELMNPPLSMRSLGDDALDRRIFQDTSRNCAIVQINRDRSATKNSNELENATRDAPEKFIYDEITSYEKLLTNTSIKPRQVELEYEDMCDEGKEISQNPLTFSGKSFTSDPAELLTSIYDERVNQDEHMMKTCSEFKQVKLECEDKHNVKKEIESYQSIAPKTHHDDIKDRFDLNCSTNRSNLKMNSLENIKDFDKTEWNRLANLYTKEAVDIPHLIEEVQNDTAEDVLSSRALESFKSENHSRSSHTSKIYLQRDIFSSRRSKSNADTPNQEMITLTNVPTLALNSQDISYSTSAGSRECSAMQPLDPHALIKALSDISLKQERQGENVPRNREDFQDKNMIDASSGASNFPTKGETWRVPRSSMSESSRKPLSRILSRIPIRIADSAIMSPANNNKLPRYYKNSENSEKIVNYEEAKFVDQNDVQSEVNKNIACQQPEVDWSYPQRCKQDSSLRSMNESIKIMVLKAHSGTFAPDDEVTECEANDYEPGSSNLQSPKSAPFGDHTYDKMRHLPWSRSSGKSCPSVFLNKTRYSSDRDYAKIDDDLQSKSDRSTSRKSAETMDVTSVTESPCMSKYKQNESFRIESPRNIEENVTWRTEDECASINDEENPEVHYESYNDKPEELYSQTKDRFKSIIEGMYNSFPSKTQLLELDLPSEMEKLAKKQSENLISQVHKMQETSGLARSPSTLNLNYDSKKKKKSLERFPFTISEASGALSIEHKDTNDYQLPDESFDHTKVDQLKEKTVYQLKMHPSLTRLATSGLEDTVADILCCISQEQKQDATTSKSRMKAIMRIFSLKLRKAPKQSTVNKTPEQTKVIYENRACQADSKANSCSGDSFTEETHRMNFKKSSKNVWIDHHVARSKPMSVSSGNIMKKTESIEAIAQEHPHRRYDRDDLWVQDIKDHFSDKKENNKTSQREDEADTLRESTSKDRYSIFLAKKTDELLESNINQDNSSKEQHNISGCVVPSDEKNKQSIDRKVSLNFVPEVEEVEDPTGCLCLRLCCFIAPSTYRSSIRKQAPSLRTKKSLLRKRKK